MSNRTTITLPRERHQQLQEIAAAFGAASLPDALGQMIRELARLGVVTTNLPGIEINRVSDGVVIIAEGSEPLGLKHAQATTLAETLRRFATSKENLGALVNLDDDWAVARQGNGIKVRFPFEGQERTMSRDLALDLADRIDPAQAEQPAA